MKHPYKNYFISRDEYLENPYEVIEFSKKTIFNRSPIYPGLRTDNLLISPNADIRNFAEKFTNDLSYNVFPGISLYETFLCFHINEICSNNELNAGWIHTDSTVLGGLVYLTPEEDNFNTGTSIFNDVSLANELETDWLSREKFHMNGEITDEFVKGFKNNIGLFKDKETIRVGNKFNRLIGYDAKMWHRPNSYTTSIDKPRLSLLFFISKFNYQLR